MIHLNQQQSNLSKINFSTTTGSNVAVIASNESTMGQSLISSQKLGVSQLDRQKSMMPESNALMDKSIIHVSGHDEGTAFNKNIYESLINQPIHMLSLQQKNLLIQQQKHKSDDDAKNYDQLILFLKRKFAIDQDPELYDQIKKLD